MSDIDDVLLDAEDKMDKAIGVAREDFGTIRTGRANAAMFNKVMVDYYGSFTPVNQLASIQIPEARSILITPYDKGSLAAVEKALRDPTGSEALNAENLMCRAVRHSAQSSGPLADNLPLRPRRLVDSFVDC
mgnify:CR=1 FL=1